MTQTFPFSFMYFERNKQSINNIISFVCIFKIKITNKDFE